MDLPYFGEGLQTTLLCPSCGYHHGDMLLMRHRPPSRVTLRVERPDRLSARVARSSNGTIRIPELGAAMEPGPQADAFVSNVEGVLRKFLDVVEGQEAVASSRSARATLAAVRHRIGRMIDGKEPFTFILEDPTGNSDVHHADAVREVLSEKEAASLKSSEMILDLSDLAPSEKDP
jgi:zinc finger protein